MARFRYYLLSFVAALVAFGVGVVWGAGPLTNQVHTTVQAQSRELSSEQQKLRERIAALEEQVHVATNVMSHVSRPLTAGQLAGRTVALFVLPGADRSLARQVATSLALARARVTTTISVTSEYVDPANAESPLEDLALRLVPPGVTFASGARPIDRVSTVLARSTVTARTEETRRIDDAGAEVLAGLQELGAIDVHGDAGRRAELAVVVAAGSTSGGSASTTEATTAALRGLVRALDAGSRGAVVIAPRSSARPPGLIAGIRGAEGATGISTVDIGDTPIGPAAAVLALAEQRRGGAGHYGVGRGAARVLPRVAPVARP